MGKFEQIADVVTKLAEDGKKLKERVDSLASRRDANTTPAEAKAKVQAATKDQLMKALKNPNTDPKVRKMIEKELDDRANRGS